MTKLERDYRHVEILNKQTVFSGYFKMDKYRLKFCKYDGDWSETIEREIFERGSGAGVLLYDPEEDKVVLIEQFRVGAVEQVAAKGSPWLIEIVAGVVENNLSPEETMIKEAKEEAGVEIKEFIKVASYYVSPGGTTEKLHLFCAKISAKDAQGFHGVADEHEDIRVVVLKTEEAFEFVKQGKVNNSSTIIALQWLEINQKYLKKQWKS